MTSSTNASVPGKLGRVAIGAVLAAALVVGSTSAPATAAAPEATANTAAVKSAAQTITSVVPYRFRSSPDGYQRGSIGSTLIYSPDYNLIDVTTYAKDLQYYWFFMWWNNKYAATLTTKVTVFKVLPTGQRLKVSTATGSKTANSTSISWASAFPNFGNDPHGSFEVEIAARVDGLYWSSSDSSGFSSIETVKITR